MNVRLKSILSHVFKLEHAIAIACLTTLVTSGLLKEWGVIIQLIAAAALGIAVMTAVHHAEVIAHKIGEGLGTLVLAVSVTVIEVGLILMLMGQAGDAGGSLARDTIFAAVMIIANGIVGLCLILGGLKYREQAFQVQGSKTLLVVLLTLSTLVFILPNFTSSTSGPTYHSSQLIFLGLICLVTYALFVFFQTSSHREYFEATTAELVFPTEVSGLEAWWSLFSLTISLVAVIGLAKFISPLIEAGITWVGAPRSMVGFIIAAIVLAPEAWAAVNASRANRLQTSLNLALGSGIASIALTIPAVIVYALLGGHVLHLGLEPKNMVFLVLTFLVSALTLGTGRATMLQGAIHGVILFSYVVMSVVP